MLLFLISALRALIEMLGLCLLAQGALYLIAGSGRERNPIYRFFALMTRGPQRLIAICLPKTTSPFLIALATLFVLFALWIGLAILRRFL